MTRIVLYLILLLIPAMGLHAQGKVTVTQSSAIDAVVNGKKSPQNDKRMSREERRAAKRAEKERQKQEKIRRKNQQLMVPSQPSSSKQRGDAPRVQLPSNRPPAAKEPKITVHNLRARLATTSAWCSSADPYADKWARRPGKYSVARHP